MNTHNNDDTNIIHKYCAPEIDTSEVIVEFQWHFPMDVQRCFSKGISRVSSVVQRIVTCPVDFHVYLFVMRRVRRDAAPRLARVGG